MIGEKWNSQILGNFPVTEVPLCTSSNTKTLGLKHLQLPNVASCSEIPDEARVVRHGKDDLPVQKNTVPEGHSSSSGENPEPPASGRLFLTWSM